MIDITDRLFQIPAKPDPTVPPPPLIGDGTPPFLYALICSNGEPAEGPPLLFELPQAGVYFLEKVLRSSHLDFVVKMITI